MKDSQATDRISVQDVSARRLRPDDASSEFSVELTVSSQSSGERCTFDWEVDVTDSENTPVRTLENHVISAVENAIDGDAFVLPDDQVVLEMRVQQWLAQHGVEVMR